MLLDVSRKLSVDRDTMAGRFPRDGVHLASYLVLGFAQHGSYPGDLANAQPGQQESAREQIGRLLRSDVLRGQSGRLRVYLMVRSNRTVNTSVREISKSELRNLPTKIARDYPNSMF